MQHYIEQLVADIRQATKGLKPPRRLWEELETDPGDELELEDLSYVEQYIEGETQPIAEITGIDTEQLPSPEKLTDQQQALLAGELENLLQYFHFYLDFPENYPVHLRYPFIRDFWAESHVPLSFGENHIEFCDYDEESCPFPGYCNTCAEYNVELKQGEAVGSDADFDFEVEDLLPTPDEMKAWSRENSDPEKGVTSSFSDEMQTGDHFPRPLAGGFYDDDGNLIDPCSVPVPGLCIICKAYREEDWEENLLCQMNRHDQRNDDDFKCGAFEKN